MRLTLYTDYSLRVLYLGAREGELCSIEEISQAYGISRNHLMKVVNDLGSSGYVSTVRGRSGGIRLGRPPGEINIGTVVRHTEGNDDVVDCANCVIAPACGLAGLLRRAMGAFMTVLDGYTLADLLTKRVADLAALLGDVQAPLDSPSKKTARRQHGAGKESSA